MIATLVREKNKDAFLNLLSENKYDKNELIIGAVDEPTETACGVLQAVSTSDNELRITNIYVSDEYRNQGAATEMVRLFCDIAARINIREADCFYIENSDNDYLKNVFYKTAFADRSPDLMQYLFKPSNIDVDMALSDNAKNIRQLKNVSAESFNTFIRETNSNLQNEKNSLGIALKEQSFYDEELSLLYLKNEKIIGSILFRRLQYEVSLEYMNFSDKENNVGLLELIRASQYLFNKKGLSDEYILVNAYHDEHLSLLDGLTHGNYIPFEEGKYFKIIF